VRQPSPEINRAYHSSADTYSHGRLPLEPPWAKTDPNFLPIEFDAAEILRDFLETDDWDGSTPPHSPSDDVIKPLEPIKKRNTLKKGGTLFRQKTDPVQ